MSTNQSEPPSPTKELDIAPQAMQPPGFAGMTACLWRNWLPEGASNPDALSMAILMGPTVETMSTSHIVKDEVMGVTYMDTMTTSVVRVTLVAPNRRP